ncbi:MAG: hypothetical protein KJ565_07540 [Gammaproteobacteria bacterium]|uniref:DUF4870 family protein n=1 Tax=Hydrogenophaga sp. TaxID=1904254 RepID=UPI0025BE2DF6|nr:hypothetical protein [Hydrogenophaga sp.]MBU4181536.1 hypothetical protein [Gammaproteobacteria bacterium]MBU4282329.1 hypothetical protein [Gammaproteobacteria bacterium]MBU4323177.1 hypothetical protein [Gammaproteobacteria bacterium]MBU4504763.1 hypothetical protein [Gammaproteobacteria bacterium]MCG2655226.1 hypothetical protein [Hydrogenophaga sp.]
MNTTVEPKAADANKTLTTVIYALYASSLLLGITCLVAIVMNYVKKDDVAGTYLESHFRWQIRTFWFALLWSVIGVLTLFLVVGAFVLLGNLVWFIYRIVKGWLYLNDGKAMYSTTA